MNNRAQHAFVGNTDPAAHALAPNHVSKSGFFPSKLLVPNYTGEGLISKEALFLRKVLEEIWKDVILQLHSLRNPNRTLKNKVHDEFLHFLSKEKDGDLVTVGESLQESNEFWNNLINSDAPFFKALVGFKERYSFRITIIYLFKIRFMAALRDAQGHRISCDDLLNPNTLFSKIFQKGGTSDLYCESLEPNAYSWYRPKASLSDELVTLFDVIKEISTTELMKVFTYTPNTQGEKRIDFSDATYSHSISHRSFGLLLNNLLVHLPHWLYGKSERINYTEAPRLPTPLITKFSGDFLSSHALSHWLAQEQNMGRRWQEIICPDFIGNEFDDGEFLKICHELYFLSVLTKIAKEQVRPTLELITKVMKEKYTRHHQTSSQTSLFQNIAPSSSKGTYDRIVLNLETISSKNPFNSLIAKITKEGRSLAPNGFLYVLTNQQLFMPSKSERIEELQKGYTIVSNFSFEKLQGRGEIPSYLYILRKEEEQGPLAKTTNVQKDICLTFEFSGELTQFNRFYNVVLEFHNLLKTRDFTTTPLLHRTVGENLFIEYHQDVLLAGKLVHANIKETASITHPNFFKNLTEACVPLETLFQVDHLNDKEDLSHTPREGLLGQYYDKLSRYPYAIIVDYTHPHHVQIELIETSILRAKKEEYGTAFYQYFGLIPKISPINLNLLRYYFESNLGTQVIGLTLTSADTKTKAKLRALLVPKFIASHQTVRDEDRHVYNSLVQGKNDLLSKHDYKTSLDLLKKHTPTIKKYTQIYPWLMASHIVDFKESLVLLGKQIASPINAMGIDFNLGPIRNEITKLRSVHLLSKESGIHLEFKSQNINLPLTYSEIKSDQIGKTLELQSGNVTLLKLYGKPLLLDFIKYILDRAYGRSIESIIQNLSVPTASELEHLFESVQTQNYSINEMINLCRHMLDELFAVQIQQKR